MPLSSKLVWASSSLFLIFPSFFPACSVAMFHKWDLILLPWLQSFSGALKSKQQGCDGAVSDRLQKCDITCQFRFWWVWWFVVLQSFYGRLLFLFCAKHTAVAEWLQGIQQFYLPTYVTSSFIVKAAKRQGSSKQLIVVWMHITGRKGNTALNSFANFCG